MTDLFAHNVVSERGVACLECGRVFVAALQRHVRTAHALTPEAYRARHGLPETTPFAHPYFTATRRSCIGVDRSAWDRPQ